MVIGGELTSVAPAPRTVPRFNGAADGDRRRAAGSGRDAPR